MLVAALPEARWAQSARQEVLPHDVPFPCHGEARHGAVPFERALPASWSPRARRARILASNNSMEPTWPAAAKRMRDTSLALARRLISRPLGVSLRLRFLGSLCPAHPSFVQIPLSYSGAMDVLPAEPR